MHYISKNKIRVEPEEIIVLLSIDNNYSKWYQKLRKRKKTSKDLNWFQSWHNQAIKIRRFEKNNHIKFLNDRNKITGWVKICSD